MLSFNPQWNQPGKPFRRTWSELANIDQFRWMVRKDVLEQLQTAHNELGIKHVRAVGFFDDEMRVLGVDPKNFGKNQKAVRNNWQITDYVIDSLLDIGINPIFCTTFVPSALKGGNASVFSTKSLTSPPRDFAKWAALIQAGVRHAIDRYGRERVRSWYFEVWNEPNLMGQHAFWGGTQEQFFELWKATFDAIKEVDSDLRIGGPSSARAEWVPEFLDFTSANQCVPDYIISHIYNNDSESGPLSPFDGPQSDRINKSPHFAEGVMRGMRALLDSRGFKGELHFNEWGRSWLPCDAIRETAVEAAFIAKTMSEVSQQADAFAYWCMSDVYDQVGYGAEAFHGNYGLLNLQGLRKPSYHAFQLLNRLGNVRLPSSQSNVGECDGVIVTREGESQQVLVYHFDSTSECSDSPCEIEIALPENASERAIHAYVVDAQHNNVLAQWDALGKPDYLSREDTASLRAENHLAPFKNFTITRNSSNQQVIKLVLQGPGIALVEIQ